MHAAQIISVGYTGRGEHDVAPRQLFDLKFFLYISDAHPLGALDSLVVARRQTALELAADAAQRRRGEHSLGRPADTQEQIDAGFRFGGGDGSGYVAIANQANACSRFAYFLDDRLVARPRQNNYGEILDSAFFGFGQGL